MTDWIQRALNKRAARDAAIPKEYLFDLAANNIEACPFEKEATPRTTDSDGKVDWKVTAAIYPTDSVMDIPRKLMDMQDVAITETSLDKLLELLASSQLTSIRCTQAFLRRAILTHQLTNCCTEIFVDWTLKRAQECDDYLKKNGKPIGLLHGLPVSLKDQFHIKGIPTTMGYVKDDKFIAKENSVITEVLLRAGAVPLVRSNIPQTLMRGEVSRTLYTCSGLV
jgi:amidase